MISEQKMREIAEHYISFMGKDIELLIYHKATIKKTYGNIFFFNSKQFAKTGDLKYHLIIGPFLVEKKTGRVVNFGTAYPLEYYLDEFEKGTLIPPITMVLPNKNC